STESGAPYRARKKRAPGFPGALVGSTPPPYRAPTVCARIHVCPKQLPTQLSRRVRLLVCVRLYHAVRIQCVSETAQLGCGEPAIQRHGAETEIERNELSGPLVVHLDRLHAAIGVHQMDLPR